MFLVMLKSPFSHFFAETLCRGGAAFFLSTPTLHRLPEAVRMFWRIQGIFLIFILGAIS
jgi:hypothetical protein